MTVYTLQHARQEVFANFFLECNRFMAVLTLEAPLQVSLMRKLLTVVGDPGHFVRHVRIRVARGALVLVFHVMTVSTDIHARKEVVEARCADLCTTMAIDAGELLLEYVVCVAENEVDVGRRHGGRKPCLKQEREQKQSRCECAECFHVWAVIVSGTGR
jgi:hypothetical protein